MKKRISLKKERKKRSNRKVFFYFFIFILVLTFTFHYLLSKNIMIDSKMLVTYLLKANHLNIKENISIKKTKKVSVIDLLNLNYYAFSEKKEKEHIVKVNKKEENKPLIYLYNSHQTEEYQSPDPLYSVRPTVTVNNYIMKETFEKENLKTLVEERNIKDILTLNNWKYAASYKASRIFLEDIKKTNPSLKYFIDIHRDSLKKDRTSITINNKNYAKIIFLIGMENENYQENLTFTEKINNRVNEKYPELSKGIYKKGGEGVNGVYNQDFSPRTILIEIGGPENTIEEVMNTTLAISHIISEVIKQDES